ncbi:hypothetical protein J5N97_006702 [Dioscorea zingiberensis]|uniref:Programmed cell death protein 2 C-terminal domain-containing protein n=1 Tax=Dioscorea zingiberensis TaxID=325984 RepID=A0A9D5DAQ4_9LILI|nr:hypothetical protein J5N97_006702 [Dioscorea zingiberensis]
METEQHHGLLLQASLPLHPRPRTPDDPYYQLVGRRRRRGISEPFKHPESNNKCLRMGVTMLGMPGPWAEDYREKADHYTTKIGGLPDWPVPELEVGSDTLKCALCGGRLCLVAQVYAPISLSTVKIEERVIYVLGCPTPKCGSKSRSWKVLRLQKCDIELQSGSTNQKAMPAEESPCSVSKAGNWWKEGLFDNASQGGGDESNDTLDLSELALALSQTATLASNLKNQNGTVNSKASRKGSMTKARGKDVNIPVLPCFYIYSQEECSSSDINTICSNYASLSMKETQNVSSAHEEEKWEGETYEYDRALGADRTYLKFKKHIDAYPEQCFRYSCGGKPLLATKKCEEPESCRACGSKRQYEMQLMSPLLYFLHEAAADSSTSLPEEWSWLTLIVYTCSNSCCPSTCREKSSNCCWAVAEEAIIIQDE